MRIQSQLAPIVSLRPGSPSGGLEAHPRREDAERRGSRSRVQGIYHQSWPGPSFQQGWAADAADGKPIWVEGSVDEEGVRHIDNVQQQQEEATKLFAIPRKFEPGNRSLLLQASAAGFAFGAVQTIKCRLSLNTLILNLISESARFLHENLKDLEESSSGTARPQRRTHWKSFSAITVATSSHAATLSSGTAVYRPPRSAG